MALYIAIDADILNDPAVQMMDAVEFKRAFMAADGPFLGRVKRVTGRLSVHSWRKISAAVFQRDDYTCAYCGQRGVRLECDHVVPVSRGGSNEMENLVASCVPCNRSKSDKLVSEWVE